MASAGESSPLSSPPSSVLSSPLSSPGSTPSPPPDMARPTKASRSFPYPSPPSSQQTSQTGSPAPDGMDSNVSTDKEGPPPAKRRRISKERSTEYLDLRTSEVDPEQQAELDQLLRVLHNRQKIVVIAGAGISVSAGIPDFRSSNGLFRSLKDEHKLKGSGKDLFDASVYKYDTSTSSFHDMVSSMSRLTKDAKPTAFHQMLATIASEDRLLRLYSQNVDSIDTCLEPLKTSVPLCKDENGKWPRTIQLHGGLDKMVCSKCHELSDFDADLFSGPTPPPCSRCEEVNDIRTNHEGKRSHGIGRLRPRMVLYNEANPDENAIGSVTSDDLRKRPDAVIVAGTTLKVPGVKRIVREMCNTVRNRRGGVAIWINTDLPPVVQELKDCFDIVVQGTCDEVASRAAMRKWDDPLEQNDFVEVSDEEARCASARKGEVRLPDCKLTHANVEALPSSRHLNNSFLPPAADALRKEPIDAPVDWSPMPCRTISVIDSIETDSDNITVDSSGLLTPTKSQKSTPVKKPTSLNTKLMKAAQQKKPAGRPSKSTTAAKPSKPTASKSTALEASKEKTKGPNIKYVKPAKSKANIAAKPLSAPKTNTLTATFKQTKKGSIINHAAKKSLPSPQKSPSKLRQVSNVSSEPMHPLSPQDPRNNTSPSKARPVFPGLQTENASYQDNKKRLSIERIMN